MKKYVYNIGYFIFVVVHFIFLYVDNQNVAYYDLEWNKQGGYLGMSSLITTIFNQISLFLTILIFCLNLYFILKQKPRFFKLINTAILALVISYLFISIKNDFYQGVSVANILFYVLPAFVGIVLCAFGLIKKQN